MRYVDGGEVTVNDTKKLGGGRYKETWWWNETVDNAVKVKRKA